MINPSKAQIEVENTLTPELRPIFRQFIDDYKSAAQQHVPGYGGGAPSFKIVAQLIREGWRKDSK